MFRILARQLDLIRYYSATPPRTGWDRLMDGAMVMAVLAALVSVWLADQSLVSERTILEIGGTLARDSSGSLRGALNDSRPPIVGPGSSIQPYGDFTFTVRERRFGLPLSTTIQPQQPMLTLTTYQDGKRRIMTPADAPPEIAACIEPLLAAHGMDDARAAWAVDGSTVQRPASSWVFGVFAWWLAWFAVLAVSLHLAQLAAAIVQGRLHRARAIRRSRNLCATCSYDLRGLEFSERCPECGTQIL